MTKRRHLTKSGRFEVHKNEGVCIKLVHAKSGLRGGGFSHLAVRTFAQALEGVEKVEAALSPEHLKLLDDLRDGDPVTTESRDAQKALLAALRETFPNGAWGP